MTKTKYKDKFDNEIKDLRKIASSASTKVSYGDIIAKKLVWLFQGNYIDKDGWEHNYQLAATLVPEWSKSLARITDDYAGLSTNGTVETENEDYQEYYEEHPSVKKPMYMWRAPLKVQFEYSSYDYPVTAEVEVSEKKNEVDELLSYDEALDKFTKYEIKRDEFLNKQAQDSVMVDYVFIKDQSDPDKKTEYPYWVYPKKYTAHFSKKYKKDLLEKKAFVLKANEYKNLPEQLAAVLKVYPATVDSMVETHQLDYLTDHFVNLNNQQRRAVGNFKFRKYKRNKEK